MIRHIEAQGPVTELASTVHGNSHYPPADEAQRTEQFVRLLSKYQQRIYSFILTLIPHWADADEVLQETNTILWRKFAEFQPESDFVRWANQVAYYEVLKFRRRRSKDILCFSESFLADVAQEALDNAPQLQAQRDSLAECLNKLSASDRKLVYLRYQQDAKTASVAQSLGRSVDSVYKSLGRIRRALLFCVGRLMAAEDRA
jgi:RNA polymerase sigma-70 factor (ECF subfamily)